MNKQPATATPTEDVTSGINDVGRVVIAGGCGAIGAEFVTAIAPYVETYVIDRDLDRALVWRNKWADDPTLKVMQVTDSYESVLAADVVVVTIGTEGRDGATRGSLPELFDQMLPYLSKTQLLVIRSTVSPGTTRQLAALADETLPGIDIVFAPERSLEGAVDYELFELPQMVGGPPGAVRRAAAFFQALGISAISLPDWESAELAKLICNGYRYVNYQLANHFEMLAEQYGCSYDLIRQVVRVDYPRADGLGTAGFVGGPCLPKDTRLLGEANKSGTTDFIASALDVSDEYGAWVVARVEEHLAGVRHRTIGILGMGFKADSQDRRASHGVALSEQLTARGATVLELDDAKQVQELSMDCLIDVFCKFESAEPPQTADGQPAAVYSVGSGWHRVPKSAL